MSESLIYRSPVGYELVMRVLYGRHYEARQRTVADLIPEASSVLELCCGPGRLYLRYLRAKRVDYVGIDVSPHFVERLRKRGVQAERRDLHAAEPLPTAEYVVIQASLYHFLPDPGQLVDRMLSAAGRAVVISEPIRNLATSRLAPVARLAQRGASPGVGEHAERFDEAALDEFMSRYSDRVERSLLLPGGREKLYELRAA